MSNTSFWLLFVVSLFVCNAKSNLFSDLQRRNLAAAVADDDSVASWSVLLREDKRGVERWIAYDDVLQTIIDQAYNNKGDVKEICYVPQTKDEAYILNLKENEGVWDDMHFNYWYKDMFNKKDLLKVTRFIQRSASDPYKQRPIRLLEFTEDSKKPNEWQLWSGKNFDDEDDFLNDAQGNWIALPKTRDALEPKGNGYHIDFHDLLNDVYAGNYSFLCVPQLIQGEVKYYNIDLSKDRTYYESPTTLTVNVQRECGDSETQFYQSAAYQLYRQRPVCKVVGAADKDAKGKAEATGKSNFFIKCSTDQDCKVYVQGSKPGDKYYDTQAALDVILADFQKIKPGFDTHSNIDPLEPEYFWHGVTSYKTKISPLQYNFSPQAPQLWTVVVHDNYQNPLYWPKAYALGGSLGQQDSIMGYIAVFTVDDTKCYKNYQDRIRIGPVGVTVPNNLLTTNKILGRTSYMTVYDKQSTVVNTYDAAIFTGSVAQQCGVKIFRCYEFVSDINKQYSATAKVTENDIKKSGFFGRRGGYRGRGDSDSDGESTERGRFG